MHFPMSPLILGFVLGEMLEQNLRRALSISNGNLAILWESGVTKNIADVGCRRPGWYRRCCV